MSWIQQIASRLRAALGKRQRDRMLDEELNTHLALLIEQNIERGMSSDAARRAAKLSLGGADQIKESVLDQRGLPLLETFVQDLRFALRMLRKSPGFTAVAILTLAVGRPGPGPGLGLRTSFSALTVERFREHTATLSDVFAFSPTGPLNVNIKGQADTASGLFVTGNYFAGLDIQSGLGRTLSVSDDLPQAESVAVISYRYWRRRFASDPSIIGKTIYVNRLPVVVVGITPEGFDGPRMSETYDITLPIVFQARLSTTGRAHPIWLWWLQMMGRLKPGVTRKQALAELQSTFVHTVRESWAARPPDAPNPTRSGLPRLRVQPGAQGPDGPRLDARDLLSAAFAIVAAILLIGCFNLATLLPVRSSARHQEVTVRVTLGASRWRVIRQLMTETLLLTVFGGIGGAILALWGKNFMQWLPARQTIVVDARIDLRVLAFTAALSTITALLFGIWPALRATRPDLEPSLRTSALKGIGRCVGSQALLVAELAVSLVLIVSAGLMVRTLYNLNRVDVGFNPENLLVFRIDPPQGDISSRVFDTYDRIMAGIEAIPGVRSCTMSVMPLIAQSEWEETVKPDGGNPAKSAFIQIARWNFLKTMGIPLVAGRDLSAADTEGRPRVAVINETMAWRLFGERAPVGRHFQFVTGNDRNVAIQVIGVVRDSKYASLEQQAPPILFMPDAQAAASGMTVEVRTAPDPMSVAHVIREVVRRTDPTIALADMKTERQQIDETIGKPRVFALLTTISGVIGLLLACIGLYGVVSYETMRRTHEIGIRMALGALPSDVLRLVIRQTVVVVTIGSGIGVALALAASQLMRSLLFGIAPSDPFEIGSALAILIAVALAASYLPARRAMKVDPTVALRYE